MKFRNVDKVKILLLDNNTLNGDDQDIDDVVDYINGDKKESKKKNKKKRKNRKKNKRKNKGEEEVSIFDPDI